MYIINFIIFGKCAGSDGAIKFVISQKLIGRILRTALEQRIPKLGSGPPSSLQKCLFIDRVEFGINIKEKYPNICFFFTCNLLGSGEIENLD